MPQVPLGPISSNSSGTTKREMYQVLARRWRPQSFAELVGQDHVARTLANAIDSGRLAHAYIFAGLRGTGKTTVARILAKCLNCAKGPTTKPCGTCVACQEIAASNAMDVLEIDAASRTKVEQTRELLEVVSYAPLRDRNKILIIDEAHMLSKASFNALLKTLEEPPPNVVFILATTELHKVLSTIVSRCQVFEFRRVAAPELARHLRRIGDESRIRISDASLERIARAGEGSVRDSLSLLERVLAFCGEQVSDDDVLSLLGAVRSQVLADMIGALARHDAAGMLTVLDAVVQEGHDLIHFWSELIAALRDLLLLDALPGRAELLARPAQDTALLAEAARGLSREDLTRAFQIVADLEPGLKGSSQPQFLFEAGLIRLASLGAVRPIEELIEGLGRRPATSGPAASPLGPVQKKKDAEGPPLAVRGSTAEFTAAVRAARPMLAAALDEASALELETDALVVRFPARMEALKRQLERADSLQLLRATARELAGRPIQVRIETDPEPESAVAGSGSTAPSGRREQRDAPQPKRRPGPLPPEDGLLDEARREPGLQKLLDAFGAQVVEISPLERAGEPLNDPDRVEESP